MLRALQANRGVIMINFNCGFLDARFGARRATWRQKFETRRRAIFRRHAKGSLERKQAITKLEASLPKPKRPDIHVLIAHVMHALDIAGANHVGIGSDFDGVPCVPAGMDDVSYLPRLTYQLLKRNVDETVVRKVLGQNLLRVFAEIETAAMRLAKEKPYRNDPRTDRLAVEGPRPWLEKKRPKKN